MEYTITEWRGLPNYECNHCPFATLNKQAMMEHLWVKHRLRVVMVAEPVIEKEESPQITEVAEPVSKQEESPQITEVAEEPKRKRKPRRRKPPEKETNSG